MSQEIIANDACLWLGSTYNLIPESKIQKSILHEEYLNYCRVNNKLHLNPASFGKIVKQIFPGITTRRIGQRGSSHYFYIGLGKISSINGADNTIETMLKSLKQNNPTLRHCPKGSRIQVAESLKKILMEVILQNNTEVWRKLLLFPYLVLGIPKKEENVKNLTQYVKNKAKDFSSISIDNACPQKKNGNFNLAKKVEAKISDGDTVGAIRLLTSNDVILSPSTEIINELLKIHPEHPLPYDVQERLPTDEIVEASCDADMVKSCILSFKAGSAGGADGLFPQILKDLISKSNGAIADDLLEVIVQFTNKIINGSIPEEISKIFFGANLTALRKKNGGIRPIAVGLTWRRLISKIICKASIPELYNHFYPNQMGVGIKQGIEIAAHAGRLFANKTTPSVLLKLDFRNAFNEIRRDVILKQTKELLPNYYNYIHQCYSKDSTLFFGQENILSRCGVQQGDPLGPLLFSIAIQPIINQISCEFNVWYLDDGNIGGDPESVFKNLEMIIKKSNEVGLQLNFTKTEIIFLHMDQNKANEALESFQELIPGVKILRDNELLLLGAPIFNETSKSCLKGKIDQLKYFLSCLNQLSSHCAFYLLKQSLSIQRLNYHLRCAPCFQFEDMLFEFDEELRKGCSEILNLDISDSQWTQATLPVKKGGLGIRRASDCALAAFISSFTAASNSLKDLLEEEVILEDLSYSDALSKWSGLGFNFPKEDKWKYQSSWTIESDSSRIDLISNNNLYLAASSVKGTGVWLNAVPSRKLGTFLNDENFTISCGVRIGSKLCESHQCRCGVQVNEDGLHGLSCKFNMGRGSRHNEINDIISRSLRIGGVPNIREPPGLSRSDGKRPDGMTLIPWKNGKSLLWDATIVDTFAPSYNIFNTQIGNACIQAEKAKLRKYEALMENYIFIPVAMETSGIISAVAYKFLSEIGNKLVDVTHNPRSKSFLFQRISFAIQRGNFASIIGTIPQGKKLEEIFYINN